MKTLLCCIGRQENRYIKEFVDYYRNIGFTNICLYDNNYDGEEHFEDVIGDDISDGFVILKDYRNRKICQLQAYQECYDEYGKQYDWIAFFDIDEFLELKQHKTVEEWLSDERYAGFDMIHVNWMLFGDSGQIYMEKESVVKRFDKPIMPLDKSTMYCIPDNNHIKSIIRGGLSVIQWNSTPHTPLNEIKCCDTLGIAVVSNSPFCRYDFSMAYLKHYTTKSCEEYAEKILKGFPDNVVNDKNSFYLKMITLYYCRNGYSKEKQEVFKKILNVSEVPLVSVIVPSYNYGKYISETLLSLKKQTYMWFECLIMDDGSTDNTKQIVKNIIEGDNRFKYYYQDNQGLAATRNNGINKSSGKYILPLDSDDYISNIYLEKGVSYLEEHPNVALYYTDTVLVKPNGKKMVWNISYSDYKTLLKHNSIVACSLYRKDDYLRVGGYDTCIKSHEDWEFYIRLLYHNNEVYQEHLPLFFYRQHDDSMNNKALENFKNAREYVMEKNKDIYIEYYGDDIKKKKEIVKDDKIKIYSLCFSMKDFDFLDNKYVTPLQVGADVSKTDVCDLKDNTGDNISEKNYLYIENTGTYWIWKNVHDCKYKGQMQYRRPLEGIGDDTDFEKIFSDHDVITCKPFNHPENSKPTKELPMCIPANTVEEGYAFSNCGDDLYVLEMYIKMKHKDYSEDYDKYIKKGENLYYSNGFIMRAEDYDRYCEFLFDCLKGYLSMTGISNRDQLYDHVIYNMKAGKYKRYQSIMRIPPEAVRWQTSILGFLSERIWTLWLQHNFKPERIMELPYIKMEEGMYT